ncbi:MlaE family lipid ABC transporter permease subunit [Salipiger sp. H15]|uniref:MlaE family lipid ABC transporter permease subunit n=1 Tax=Alloyangia sp. H15 TaxID=3029062 RepID=A0AAU8AM16_9RHOB
MTTGQMQVGHGESSAEGVITLSGPLTVHEVADLHAELSRAQRASTVDLSGVSRIDTAGAWALAEFEQRVGASGGALSFRGASDGAMLLLDTVRRAMPVPETPAPAPRGIRALLEATGRRVMGGALFLRGLLEYLGMFIAGLARVLIHPREFRFTALVAHCDDVGLRAVPIVSLMAFLIGVVLAFQGATQLRQFGAEVFVVDLIAISVLRELGILLTAIIVAGRTASAFTAAIGSMKMRQEIDAMRTLGLDPVTVLFVPRILALLLMLPILGLIADIMGLFGGALMSWIELGISPSMFRTRLIADTDISNVIVGLVKAPVFAVIIGVVGCHAGMQVKGDAESLGRMTSSAVVTAIFAVIVADALFSIFFAEVGL